MPRTRRPETEPVPEGVSSFPWSVEAWDRRHSGYQHPGIRFIQHAQNRRDHELHGVPLKSDAEFDLEGLEEQLAGRELRVRADDGDPEAVALLVEEAARYELMIDRARERAAAREARRGG
jgi:hypothetical protein